MARLFDNAQNEYLSRSGAVLNAVPFAFVCQFYSDDIAAGQFLMSLSDASDDSDIFALVAQGDAAGDYLRASCQSVAGGWDVANTTSGYSANTWHHGCALFVSATDRRVLIDNGNKGTNTANNTPVAGNLDLTNIGALIRLNPTGYMSGRIAEAAIYDLSEYPGATASDKADYFEANVLPDLAIGVSPECYQTGLTAYWPLRDDDEDDADDFDLTPYNTPSWAAHPDVIYYLAGSLGSQSTLTGNLQDLKELAGLIEAQSALTGDIKVTELLAGLITSQSSTEGNLISIEALAGLIVGQSTVSANIDTIEELAGSVGTTSSCGGTLNAVESLAGIITAQSSVTGDLIIPTLGHLSDYAENKALDHITGKAPYAKPTVYLGFCTTNPGEEATGADCNEVPNTNGYARVATTGADWNSASGGSIDNANKITSPCASGSWGEITHYVLVDSGTYGEGNVLVHDELDTARVIEEDDMLEFAAGALSLALN